MSILCCQKAFKNIQICNKNFEHGFDNPPHLPLLNNVHKKCGFGEGGHSLFQGMRCFVTPGPFTASSIMSCHVDGSHPDKTRFMSLTICLVRTICTITLLGQ